MVRLSTRKEGRILRGYEIFRRIWEETKGGQKFSEHPLAKTEFEEVKKKEQQTEVS